MRDFRFRAWDKVGKVMYTGLPHSNVGKTGLDDFSQVLKHPMIYDVMQYTGFKDKNGTEVYESDVILAGHYQWKCKVVWEERCARFIGTTNDKDVKIVYVDMVDKNDISAVEVVGNIYENPELLATLN